MDLPKEVNFEQKLSDNSLPMRGPASSAMSNKEKTKDLGDWQKDKGTSLTFTFKEGLNVQILPSGAV